MTVDVWHVGLDVEAERIAALASVLSAEETARASRFRSARDRNRYVAGRAALRRVLSSYCGREAAELGFEYSATGKPGIGAVDLAGGDLHFNVSHSDGIGLIAVAPVPVGVDLERVRPLPDVSGVAARVLAPQETAALAAVPSRRRSTAFFDLWVRKEALLKATGEGLSGRPDRLNVIGPAGEGGPERATIVRHDGHDWFVRSLSPGGGFRGAIAVRLLEGDRPRLRQRRWEA